MIIEEEKKNCENGKQELVNTIDEVIEFSQGNNSINFCDNTLQNGFIN